jgi:hypothetical protein
MMKEGSLMMVVDQVAELSPSLHLRPLLYDSVMMIYSQTKKAEQHLRCANARHSHRKEQYRDALRSAIVDRLAATDDVVDVADTVRPLLLP